jgi:DNA repair exonuclease SbcCD ATPase subunit
MKKIFLLIALIFLVGCGSKSELDPTQPETDALETKITAENNIVAELENQVQNLTESLNDLQSDYITLQAELNAKEDELETEQAQAGEHLCDVQIETMKYDNLKSALAVINGWFVIQPEVQEMQGEYTIQFWNEVESRMHTIRYISAEDNLSTTASFLIFFEEAGWKEGVLWLTKQCWLDYPH